MFLLCIVTGQIIKVFLVFHGSIIDSVLLGLNIKGEFSAFNYFHTMCKQAAKTLVGPQMCDATIRPLVKSAYQNNNLLISPPKHMLWVLKRTISMRRFF